MKNPETLIKRVVVEFVDGTDDVIEDDFVLSEVGSQLLSYTTKEKLSEIKEFFNKEDSYGNK